MEMQGYIHAHNYLHVCTFSPYTNLSCETRRVTCPYSFYYMYIHADTSAQINISRLHQGEKHTYTGWCNFWIGSVCVLVYI